MVYGESSMSIVAAVREAGLSDGLPYQVVQRNIDCALDGVVVGGPVQNSANGVGTQRVEADQAFIGMDLDQYMFSGSHAAVRKTDGTPERQRKRYRCDGSDLHALAQATRKRSIASKLKARPSPGPSNGRMPPSTSLGVSTNRTSHQATYSRKGALGVAASR